MVYLQRWHGWCHMKLLPSRRVLCTPYNHAPCHFMQSHIRKVYACLAVTCTFGRMTGVFYVLLFLKLCGVNEYFSSCVEWGSAAHAVWSEGVLLLMLCGVRECFSCCVEWGSASHAVWSVGVFLMLCGVWKGVFCTLCWYRSILHAVWSAGGSAFHVVLLNLWGSVSQVMRLKLLLLMLWIKVFCLYTDWFRLMYMLLCVRVNECVYMYVLQKGVVVGRGGGGGGLVCDAVSVAGRRPAWGPVWPGDEALGWSTEGPRFDSAWAGLSLQRPLLRLGGGGVTNFEILAPLTVCGGWGLGVPMLRYWPSHGLMKVGWGVAYAGVLAPHSLAWGTGPSAYLEVLAPSNSDRPNRVTGRHHNGGGGGGMSACSALAVPTVVGSRGTENGMNNSCWWPQLCPLPSHWPEAVGDEIRIKA